MQHSGSNEPPLRAALLLAACAGSMVLGALDGRLWSLQQTPLVYAAMAGVAPVWGALVFALFSRPRRPAVVLVAAVVCSFWSAEAALYAVNRMGASAPGEVVAVQAVQRLRYGTRFTVATRPDLRFRATPGTWESIHAGGGLVVLRRGRLGLYWVEFV